MNFQEEGIHGSLLVGKQPVQEVHQFKVLHWIYDSEMTDTLLCCNTLDSRFTTSKIHYSNNHLVMLKVCCQKNTSSKTSTERRVNKSLMQTKRVRLIRVKALIVDLLTQKALGQTNMQADTTPATSREVDTRRVELLKGHRFSPNKNSVVYEKTSPRADLRWKPTGKIFKSVGLRWIPTGKLFDSCTSNVDSELKHGLNVDIVNIQECKQTLDVSAGTSINVQKEQSLYLSADMIKLESLFGHLFNEYLNGENQVVSKSSVVTTADASDKRQQQLDSTSSTSTLATTVTADGNFDL
ncbi:hypothetical protein Tco_1504726 [Tanacetum coccineum]